LSFVESANVDGKIKSDEEAKKKQKKRMGGIK
jgi:hypothetical protein